MRMSCLWMLAASCAVVAAQDVADPKVSRVTPVVRATRRARPAVVNISTEKIISTRWGMFGRDIFEDIFPSPFRRRVPVHSLGSGFIVHPAGYIVTNAHVVRRAQTIHVKLADKSQHPARIISSDEAHDLAVLKIDPPKGKALSYLPLGRSDDLMVGETVIAIGNPLGYSHTVSCGIISALDRKLEFRENVSYGGLIQTDTPINPGSSGGPLLNIRGELIGINTAIRADAQNIGFAIPVDFLMNEFPALLDFERIQRAVFGAKVLQRHAASGDELYVAEVRPGTPAAGKLRAGDRVISLNGRRVRQIPEFTCGMLSVKSGSAARLEVVRGGKTVAVRVAVRAKPRPDGKRLAGALFGMTLRKITPALARELRLPVTQGLLVVGIDEAGPAHRIGLRLKDVIFQVGKYYVGDLESLGMLLEGFPAGGVLRIGVARGSVAVWAQIRARRSSSQATTGASRGSI